MFLLFHIYAENETCNCSCCVDLFLLCVATLKDLKWYSLVIADDFIFYYTHCNIIKRKWFSCSLRLLGEVTTLNLFESCFNAAVYVFHVNKRLIYSKQF